jgi:murein DD-endopeptidase MepM/ murein hydrolase activator NlpD
MPASYSIELARLMSASSLSAVVGAQARLADADLAALDARRAEIESDRDRVRAEIVSYLAVHQIDDDVLVAKSLQRREQRVLDDEDTLATIAETVTAKRAYLARLDARARILASASDPTAASLVVLRSLADDASDTARAIAELTRGAAGTEPASDWQWPVRGAVTQPFGPSLLTLEPSFVYRGIAIAHFHDAVDIAAPFGAAVVAASSGRVTFVGHLPDGAMVVLIAHDDGLVSLSAHLDDTFAPPPVKVGQRVAAGQVVGFVGLTGITTGPHLHFSVHDANGPVDPLSVLAR